jgi:hypothetical protein
MTWAQREAAGVSAEQFQAALAKKGEQVSGITLAIARMSARCYGNSGTGRM